MTIDPLERIRAMSELRRPVLDSAAAAALAIEWFEVPDDITVVELGSNQDRNFLARWRGDQAVLKVANAAFSQAEIGAQTEALLHLAPRLGPTIAVPGPRSSRRGRLIEQVDVSGERCLVRLVDFLPGAPLTGYLAPPVVARLGEVAGRVARALVDFDHPGLRRRVQWDLRHGHEVVASLLDRVSDRELASRVADASTEAFDWLHAQAPSLRLQAIHGDLTDDNVVAVTGSDGRPWITGVIDLGDLMTSWLVGELAVTCSSVLHHFPNEPARIVGAIRAFHAIHPLNTAEIEALWPAIVARAAVIVVSGHAQVALEPDNAYAVSAMSREADMFRTATSIPLEVGRALVRWALGLPGRTWSPPISVPIVAHDAGALETLDLSTTSPLLDGGRWLTWDGSLTDRATVTRHGEARLTESRLYAESLPETVAIGIDVGGPQGTGVRIPLPGVTKVEGGRLVVETSGGYDIILENLDIAVANESAVPAGDPVGRLTRRPLRVQVAPSGLRPPRFVAPDLAPAWLALCPDPLVLLGSAPLATDVASSGAVLDQRNEALASVQEAYYAKSGTPVPRIERGWREHLIDTDGRAYVDMINNVAMCGHGHPRIAEAAARQWRMLNTNSRFNYRIIGEYAARLAALLPTPLDTVFLVNSGSEAVDLALRLAKIATGRPDVICVREGYHGWTEASDAVSTSIADNPRALATRPSWVHPLAAPNAYRGLHRGETAGAYASEATATIDMLADTGHPPAAFIAETLFGNAGGVLLPDGYLASVYDAIRRHGGVTIADEVQVGLGRLGHHRWGFEQQGVVPDIVTIAKALGNGHPLGAVITTRAIAESFRREGYFFSSAGGSNVSCAVGMAVLDVWEEEGLQANAAAVGDHLIAGLSEMAGRTQLIGAVHGLGLYLGVELVRDRETLEPAAAEANAICERMLEMGVVVQPTGDHQNVLKVKPPLCITRKSADVFLDCLDRSVR